MIVVTRRHDRKGVEAHETTTIWIARRPLGLSPRRFGRRVRV
jgi:hypothetical protein